MTPSIPEPPREPRWRPCMARRWVIGLIGFIWIDLAICLCVARALTGSGPPTEFVVGAVLGPGLVLLGFWFRGVLRLRVMLREGTLVEAETIEAKRILGLNPPHLRLRYRLRDDAGHPHQNTQFVRVRSALGRHLLEQQPATVWVIHDRHDPDFSRAVGPDDFLIAAIS